jgi:hypothetical protein
MRHSVMVIDIIVAEYRFAGRYSDVVVLKNTAKFFKKIG